MAITLDNASNNTKMVHTLQRTVAPFRGEQTHGHCFAHILNLVAKDITSSFERRFSVDDIDDDNYELPNYQLDEEHIDEESDEEDELPELLDCDEDDEDYDDFDGGGNTAQHDNESGGSDEDGAPNELSAADALAADTMLITIALGKVS